MYGREHTYTLGLHNLFKDIISEKANISCVNHPHHPTRLTFLSVPYTINDLYERDGPPTKFHYTTTPKNHSLPSYMNLLMLSV